MPPVPIYVKGGVWSNIEDQILKAAIQKYGTHQWSKIASLLQKKTAKQCELRWSEFLNPSLNFTPFSKEEDARLLELVTRLPNQWRTIAGAMGRTPQVCVDRYNVLLEATDSDVKLGSSTDFEVGDIDLNAESRPARPDADELESMDKEMLAEARARLLNTQGKKATRKIRERMLEESKRVARLQKRRELKQAGIDSKIRAPRKRYGTEIDYNADVVYEQEPGLGPYDTTEEDERAARAVKNFEGSVDRKGLREDEEKSKLRRKRVRDEKPAVVSNSTVLTNDYKKPKLELPPYTKTDSMIQALSKRSKKSILRLFKKLPKPKNDFEIELDEEEEEDEEEDEEGDEKKAENEVEGDNKDANLGLEDNNEIAASDQVFDNQSKSELSFGFRDHYGPTKSTAQNLPLPDPIINASNQVDREFNELLASSLIAKPAIKDPEFAALKSSLGASVMEPMPKQKQTVYQNRVKVLLESTLDSGPSMGGIQEAQAKLETLQRDLSAVETLEKRNQEYHHELFSVLLPKLFNSQQTYFLDYRKYQNEYYAVAARRSNLEKHLDEAGASKGKRYS
ncbi:LANO_0H16974g1_1 [Lachancea nothofagi CBS 11611]|uniref:Pre-mRNA-splicing factor CEF1 n=1 Tax=Lachancea nothofagi CBS 11611 TaxID=1266666 RepID=A0A1G4KN06_9SACH|nr:LANO_0H16974g1_1 [Lachancea nothofagi CBS 11611]